MHELSICGAIADIVTRKAGERRVETIHLRIGQLRQIVPDTLEFCWTMVSADTELDGSRIAIESVPATLTCRSCGAVTELDEIPVLACAQCAGVDVEVTAGDECLVTALELR